MSEEMPYFMNNEKWYSVTLDKNNSISIKLTEKATDKAIESYNRWLSEKGQTIILKDGEVELIQ